MPTPPSSSTDTSADLHTYATDEQTPVIGSLRDNASNVPDNSTLLSVLAVNHYGPAVGSTVRLASGAHLTVNDDGSFVYDPAGSFDSLDTGEVGVDTFSFTGTFRTFPDGRIFSVTTTIRLEIGGVSGTVANQPGAFDFILGTVGDDWLGGTADSDVIYALAGDDVVSPGDGSNTIDGDEGSDTVLYEGARIDYKHDLNAGGSVSVHRQDGETDMLLNVERIQFDDGAFILDEEIEGPNLLTAYRFYAAGLGRTADEDGLRYWIEQLDYLDDINRSTDKERFLAEHFLVSEEFRSLHGGNLEKADYVDSLYQIGLGRTADDEGRAFWISALERGLEYGDLLIAFAQCTELAEMIAPDLDNGVWVV